MHRRLKIQRGERVWVWTLNHHLQRVALKSIVDQTVMDSSHISLRPEESLLALVTQVFHHHARGTRLQKKRVAAA